MIEPVFVSLVLDARGPFIKKASGPKLVTVPALVIVELMAETVYAAPAGPVESVAPLAIVPVTPVRFRGVAQTPGELITPSPAAQSARAAEAARTENNQTVAARVRVGPTMRSLDSGIRLPLSVLLLAYSF